jgi:D-xylonolactonase
MVPTVAAEVKCRIGEGVLFHPDEGTVYWVDIPTGELYRYDPAIDDYAVIHADPPIGGFTFQSDGSILLFGAEGRITRWKDGETSTLVDRIKGEEQMRFNDVIADPEGRVFAGTMTDSDHTVGRLYRLDTDGSVTKLEESIELPNGMGFSPDTETFYFVETNTNTIYHYDYEAETGELSNREVFSRRDGEGNYDGLTVDAGGGVWTGLWNGGAIVRHTLDGRIDKRIDLPAMNITTLSFGGEEYRTVYVISATYEAELSDTDAGRLFQIEPGAEGKPEYYSSVSH